MKKQVYTLLAVLCMAVMMPLMSACTPDAQDDEERDAATIIGTWKIDKATVGYTLKLIKKDLKLKLDEDTVKEIFGSTMFTFKEDGKLQVGDNYSCFYEVDKKVTLLTMEIEDMTFSCHIDGITAKQLSLSLTGQEVKDYVLKYTSLDVENISPNVNCKLVLARE